MPADCTFCGCDVESHDPVFVEERVDGRRRQTGQYCNYGCLVAHIEERNLAAGSACNVDV